jgi:hypothetical protein
LINQLGPDVFTYTVIHQGTNFLSSFNAVYPNFYLSVKDLQLLEAFTKYELALIEQSYLDRFKPRLNTRFIATTSSHPHLLTPAGNSTTAITSVIDMTNRDTGHTLNSTTPQVDISNWIVDPKLKVQILDVNGNPLGSFGSLGKASTALNTNHMKLSRYAKSIDTVFIDYLGIEIDIHCQGFEKQGSVIHPSAKVHPPLSHDLQLPQGKVSVLSKDLSTIIGSYATMYAAATAFGIRPIEVRRYIGTTYLVPTIKGSFYFDTDTVTLDTIRNRVPHQPKSLLAHDLVTGVISIYSSVNKASKALKIHHEFITKHLDSNSIFTSRDGQRKYKFTAQ